MDTSNEITRRFKMGSGRGMHDRWPDFGSLKKRQINIRLYERDTSTDSVTSGPGAPKNQKFVCAIFNNCTFWAVGHYFPRPSDLSPTQKITGV